MQHINKKNLIFVILSIVAVWMVYTPLSDLLSNPEHSEYYSHILLIPLVSGYFFYTGRKEIFSNPQYSIGTGGALVIIGFLLYVFGWSKGQNLNQNDYTSFMTFSVILFFMGAFIFIYGTQAFRKAIFPVLFLFLMVPIPSVLMEEIVSVLLAGSTVATHVLFKLSGMPFLKEGRVFHLPGITIEIAKECSGIRSSLGLFITAILAGHLLFKSDWKKLVLLLSVFPITVLKNGIRIVTLSWLAVYVDEKFITESFLHRSGGFLFYLPALLLLGIVVWWLRKS